MNDSKRLVGKIGLVGISNIIGRITMILLVPILTKSLTVDDYGLWVIIVATIGLAPSLINLSLPSALIRYLPSAKDKESKQEVFYSVMLVILITSGLATLVLFALAGPISASLLKSELIVAQLLALIIFFNCIFSLAVSFFNGILKIRKYSLIVILKNVLNLLFIGIFIGEGHGITGAVIGLAISDGLIVLFAVGMVVMEIGIKLPSFGKVREYLRFSLPIVPSDISSWVVRSSDRYLIGLMLGAAFVGFYSPAYTLGDVIVMYTVPISIILYPTLSRYYDEKRLDSLERTLSHSIKYYLALSIPTLFGLS